MVDSVINPAFNKVQTDRASSFRQLTLDTKSREAAIKADLDAIPGLVARTKVAMAICETAVGTVAPPSTSPGTTPTTGFLPKGVAVEDDSIGSGGGNNPTSYPTQYGTLTGVRILNLAVSGSTLNQLNNDYAANDHAGTKFNASTMDTLVIGRGLNDLALDNATVATLKEKIQSVSAKARATGWKVWIRTLLKRGLSSSWTQEMENRRLEYVAWQRANWQNFADGLFDAEASTTLDDLYDQIHPKDSGALKMAVKLRDSFAAAGSSVVPGVVDSITTNGVIDADKYRSIDLSSTAGIAYRYGNPSAPMSNLPTWYKPPDKRMPVGDIRNYQLGTYNEDSGDFASNVLHIAYAPDDPNARIGVSDIQATSNGHYVVSLLPELSWVRYGSGLDGTEPQYWRARGKRVKNPVAMAHAFGRPGWAVETICVFDDGFICTVGANTMTNKTFCYLGAGKKPTGAAVTSSNEFLLVTVWDTINLRGEVAVVSLTGLGEGATIANQDPDRARGKDFEGWWGEWRTAHPGMHNLGNFAYMKVLGYIPLPGMMAPTEITATTGHHRFRYLNGSGYNETTGNTGNWTDYEDQRQRWAVGDYGDRYARQGIAVVISKTESKAIFLDLKPLFSYLNSMYFGSRENYLKTTNIGDGAGQWPYTLDEAPAQKPTIIKTVNLPSKPTATLVYPYTLGNTPKRAWIATEDGKLRTFDLGGYPQGGTPDQIVEINALDVGANPTSIAPIKEKAQPRFTSIVPDDVTSSVVVGVRSIKAAVFVDFTNNGTTGVIRRIFQDSRVKDLIRVEDHDNHGTVQYTCSIADGVGRQVHNFRYGRIRMETYPGKPEFGMGVNGNDQFEYSGSFPVPGYPWWVGTANIS